MALAELIRKAEASRVDTRRAGIWWWRRRALIDLGSRLGIHLNGTIEAWMRVVSAATDE